MTPTRLQLSFEPHIRSLSQGKHNTWETRRTTVAPSYEAKYRVGVIGCVDGDPFSDYEEPYEGGQTGFGQIGGIIRFANGSEWYAQQMANTRRG